MSLNISGEKCAVCHAYLFEEDDIVYCPECGAPHHRDCYAHNGHCALSEYHGTDKQYQRPQPQDQSAEAKSDNEKITPDGVTVCGMCGESFDKNDTTCPKCGAPNISKMGGRFVRFDFLGGVPSDMDLGSGVTADEAKMFVGSNTQRYIPKFAGFKAGKKTSWNWLAFLAPCAWLSSRKMYGLGVLAGALQVAFAMFIFPLNSAISHLDFSGVKNYIAMSDIIIENLPSIGIAAVITAAIGMTLDLLLRIISGIFGDYWYRKRVISEVVNIKAESEDVTEDYRRKGGISFISALIGIFAVEYLPSIILMLM